MLLDAFKPLAISKGWLWVGADMSESVSISEDRLALRLMTDLSVVTSSIVITWDQKPAVGFGRGRKAARPVPRDRGRQLVGCRPRLRFTA